MACALSCTTGASWSTASAAGGRPSTVTTIPTCRTPCSGSWRQCRTSCLAVSPTSRPTRWRHGWRPSLPGDLSKVFFCESGSVAGGGRAQDRGPVLAQHHRTGAPEIPRLPGRLSRRHVRHDVDLRSGRQHALAVRPGAAAAVHRRSPYRRGEGRELDQLLATHKDIAAVDRRADAPGPPACACTTAPRCAASARRATATASC